MGPLQMRDRHRWSGVFIAAGGESWPSDMLDVLVLRRCTGPGDAGYPLGRISHSFNSEAVLPAHQFLPWKLSTFPAMKQYDGTGERPGS